MTAIKKYILVLLGALAVICTGCDTINDNRIPALAVSIKLDNPGLWDKYGVHVMGEYCYFVRELNQPSGFYTANTYTGFGGVLLIGGMNLTTSEPNVPLAYDMACPVERDPEVRVAIDPDNLDAVCPVCTSRYDVIMGAGAPVGGPALTGATKYRLQTYRCHPVMLGGFLNGYVITR